MGDRVETARITWFKEIITALIGFMVIFAMLFFLSPHLLKSPPDVQNAQAIFTMFGGWGGGILGYYLGRLPSERAATRAEVTASSAEKARDVAKADLRKNVVQCADDVSSGREEFETLLRQLRKLNKQIDEL